MNCKTVLRYQKDFFRNELDIEFRDELLSHITICPDCHKAYKEYAQKCGLVFDLTREILKVVKEYEREDFPKSISLMMTKRERKKQNDDNYPMPIIERSIGDKWVTASKLNDYSELMRVYAVRKIFMTKEDNKALKDTEYGEKKRLFTNFIIKKICQKIDYLEKCLSLESKERDI